MGSYVSYEYTVSDDGTITRKNLSHPEKRPIDKKNIGGSLPK